VIRPRRPIELGLLTLAWVVGAFGTVQIGWATGEGTPVRLWITVIAVILLSLAMHVTVVVKAPHADQLLLPVGVMLTVLGLVTIYRIDVAAAQRAARNDAPAPTPDVYAQLTWFAVAVVLFIAVLILLRDHRRLQRYTYTLGLLGLVLLILPLAPVIGTTVNGATLWIRVANFSFQPAELAKILLTCFFAGYLVVKRDSLAVIRTKRWGIQVPRPRDLGPIAVAWLISLGVLVFERDLGTSVLFFGIFVTMLYIATQRRSWLIIGAGLFLIGGALAYLLFAHVRSRVTVWLDPWAYADTAGYQLVQSLYGFANGGILGAGLGQGFPTYVPFASTDFIVTGFAEELGLTGVVALLLLYAILIERGLRTAITIKDPYGQLLAAGLSITLALQVFVIIGGISRLIPLTGLTTPFLSYGGSSLVANWIIIALLLRISDRARQPHVLLPPSSDMPTTVVPR
jgi:cell division protein FtsW (lipid II flippase)